jgi:predicted RNase H-like nuclease
LHGFAAGAEVDPPATTTATPAQPTKQVVVQAELDEVRGPEQRGAVHGLEAVVPEIEAQEEHGARDGGEGARAEDPVDAVLCAYIARFAALRPDDVTVYGDTATGAIVTPTLPASSSSR